MKIFKQELEIVVSILKREYPKIEKRAIDPNNTMNDASIYECEVLENVLPRLEKLNDILLDGEYIEVPELAQNPPLEQQKPQVKGRGRGHC